MYIRVHVVPEAKRERIVQKNEYEWDIAVKEPASRNLANMRIRELLAAQYNTKRERVRIVTGHRSPTKLFAIDL